MKNINPNGFLVRLFKLKYSALVHVVVSILILYYLQPETVSPVFIFFGLMFNWLLWVFTADLLYTTYLKRESIIPHLAPNGKLTLLIGIFFLIALLWANMYETMGVQIIRLYMEHTLFLVAWMFTGCVVFEKTVWYESNNPKLPH